MCDENETVLLQDKDKMNPQKFLKAMQLANNKLLYMQLSDLTVNPNNKLTNTELITAFFQSLPPDWEIKAKNLGLVYDTFKLLPS